MDERGPAILLWLSLAVVLIVIFVLGGKHLL
jgi:hypothetical protein